MRWKGLGAATVTCVALAGCGSLQGRSLQSAPAGHLDKSPAQVIQMPSGFRNFSIKCVDVQGNWMVVASGTSHGGVSVAMQPGPKCTHDGG